MSPSSDASRQSSGDSSLLDTILGDRKVDARVRAAAERALPRLADIDDRRPAVRMRVLEAFLAEGIAESDLAGSTGGSW